MQVISLEHRSRKTLRSLIKLRNSYREIFAKSAAQIFLLLVAFAAYVFSAIIDANQSFVLWVDIMDSDIGGGVVAAARVALAILSSVLLFEPYSPILTGRSARPQGQSGAQLANRSKTKWVYSAAGFILSAALVFMMWLATSQRIGLEILTGLIPGQAGYRSMVPIAAVIVEILTGFALIEVFVLGVGNIRKVYLSVSLGRLRKKRGKRLAMIENYWNSIVEDQQELRRTGQSTAELRFSVQVRTILKNIDSRFDSQYFAPPTAPNDNNGSGSSNRLERVGLDLTPSENYKNSNPRIII